MSHIFFTSYISMLKRFLIGCLVFASVYPVNGASLIQNGDFGAGKTGWGLFIPAESKDDGCRFIVSSDAHSGSCSAEMGADQFARFGILPKCMPPVKCGERYRVVAWLKAGSNIQFEEGTSGIVIRFTLRHGWSDASGSPTIFVGINRKVVIKLGADSYHYNDLFSALPPQWTKVEAVFAIPDSIKDVDNMMMGIFAQNIKGSVLIDDVELQKVAENTPLSLVAYNGVDSCVQTGISTTDDEALAALNLDAPGMENVKMAAKANNLDAVKKEYLIYRRTKCAAKWSVDPNKKPKQATEKANAIGDELCAHKIRDVYYRMYRQETPVDMGKDFNWTFNPVAKSDPSFTDEWTYAVIGRMPFWRNLANAYWSTLDEKYARGWVEQLFDFTTKNNMNAKSPDKASLWRTLDAAIRVDDSWPYAYYHFIFSDVFTPEANWVYYKSINDHIRLLKAGLDNHKRCNNWVAKECSGLYTTAVLFPELRNSAMLRDFAVQRILEEYNHTVPADGFEAELTPGYHYMSMGSAVDMIKLGRLNQLDTPKALREKVLSMYTAPVMMMDQSGVVPGINDSPSVNVTNISRDGVKLLGEDPTLVWAASDGNEGKALPEFTMLPYAGFYAMRGGWKNSDAYLFFRAGPAGIVHHHEDMLEVVFRAFGKTFLFDPGNYTYDHSDWRRYTINCASHNTVIVDGKWQHRGTNKPPVTEKVNNPLYSTPLFDFVSGCFDGGYQQNVYNPQKPYTAESWVGEKDFSISHTRRVLFLKPYYGLILDSLDGTGTHQYDAHFHLDSSAARVDPQSQAIVSQDDKETPRLALFPMNREHLKADVVQGQKDPLLGWYPSQHRAIPTARFSKTQEAPAIFSTFLYPFMGPQPRFQAVAMEVGNPNVWADRINTERENMEVVVAKDNSAYELNIPSELVGSVQANTGGLVIRKLFSIHRTVLGAWNLKTYKGKKWSFKLKQPGAITWIEDGERLLVFNANTSGRPAEIEIEKPFSIVECIPEGKWLEVSSKGSKETASPLDALEPLQQRQVLKSYADYCRENDNKESACRGETIHFQACSLKLPEGASLLRKMGSKDPVIAIWEKPGSSISSSVRITKPGWYNIKLRYCAQGRPSRSVLIGGAIPFAEAEEIRLPSTQGDTPSDGWSNQTDDWREMLLGASKYGVGLKFYLPAGESQIALLQRGGGGCNVDWMEIIPIPEAVGPSLNGSSRK